MAALVVDAPVSPASCPLRRFLSPSYPSTFKKLLAPFLSLFVITRSPQISSLSLSLFAGLFHSLLRGPCFGEIPGGLLRIFLVSCSWLVGLAGDRISGHRDAKEEKKRGSCVRRTSVSSRERHYFISFVKLGETEEIRSNALQINPFWPRRFVFVCQRVS